MIETKIESDAPEIRLCDGGNGGVIEARLAPPSYSTLWNCHIRKAEAEARHRVSL